MYIANHSHRSAGAVRLETLRQWVEVLLAKEPAQRSPVVCPVGWSRRARSTENVPGDLDRWV